MLTPLAPWISVTTPWAETEAARAATSANCEIYIIADYMIEINSKWQGRRKFRNTIMRKHQAEERGKKRRGCLLMINSLAAAYTYSYTCLRASPYSIKSSLRLCPPTNDFTTPLDKHKTSLAFPVFHSGRSRSPWPQSRTCFRNAISIFLLRGQTCLATAKRFPTRLARVDDVFRDF